MKFNKVLLIVTSLLILLPILVGAFTWDILPEQIATHWGTDGMADDWSSRAFAVFGLPMLLLVIHWICIIITAADHKRREQNKKAYNMVLFIMPFISCFTNGIMYATAFGLEFNMFSLVFGLLGIMFVIIGNYMPKIKQNHTLGIKISWTLESEENWNATHRLAGKLWFAVGIICLACVFLPYKISVFVMPALLVAAITIPIIYSYCYYLKEKKKGKRFMKNKKLRKYYIISGIVVGVIFAVLMFIMFTGEVEISYTEEGFTIDSMYTSPYTVKYTDIGGTEYSETYIDGHKVFGFNSAKLMMGTFENDKFGKYQRFTYTGNNGFIIIETMDEEYIILGAKTLGETRALFDELTEKIAG